MSTESGTRLFQTGDVVIACYIDREIDPAFAPPPHHCPPNVSAGVVMGYVAGDTYPYRVMLTDTRCFCYQEVELIGPMIRPPGQL